LEHELTNEAQIHDTIEHMAAVVDEQNSGDADYQAMAGDFDSNIAYQAALELCLKGKEQPNGYTEPLLHQYRLRLKAQG
jgi:malate synthase